MCSLILILLYSIPANTQIMSATNNNVIMAQRTAPCVAGTATAHKH